MSIIQQLVYSTNPLTTGENEFAFKNFVTPLEFGFIFLAFSFWLVGDLVTTFVGLSLGAVEINPLFFWLTTETFWMNVIIKTLCFFGCIGILFSVKKEHPKLFTEEVILACLVYFFIFGWYATLNNFSKIIIILHFGGV